MGRHRSSLKRKLDIKSKLFLITRIITMDLPLLRRLFSFFPECAVLDARRVTMIHRSVYKYPWVNPSFDAPREFVSHHNVDAMTASSWGDPCSTSRIICIIKEIIVPGHRVTAVDPKTATLVSIDTKGFVNWNLARPSLSSLSARKASSDLTIIIPKITHYGHLLTDVLMPYFFALQEIGFSNGNKINVITCKKPVPLVIAFIAAIRHLGYEVTHISASMFETIHVPQMLYAATLSRNIELKFATPETLDFAKHHLTAVLPKIDIEFPTRIFLNRGNTRTRQVQGETELADKLKEIGFVSITGKWSNLAEQIAFFSRAEIIVAVHGGGLANVLWSKSGGLLIEILADDARKLTGLHWSSAVGFSYFPLAGSNEHMLQNFSFDSELFFKTIKIKIDSFEKEKSALKEVSR